MPFVNFKRADPHNSYRQELSELVEAMQKDFFGAGGLVLVLHRKGRRFYVGYDAEGQPAIKPLTSEDAFEEPRLFTDVDLALTYAKADIYGGLRATLAYWLPPDVIRPLPKYQRVTGHQLPGCPTQ